MLIQPAFFTKSGDVVEGIGEVLLVDQDDSDDTIALYDQDGAGHMFGMWDDVHWLNHPSN